MSDATSIREHLDTIEEAYEFMLAYAAQGRAEEGAGPDGAHIRTFVENFVAAAEAMAPEVLAVMERDGATGAALRDSFRTDSETVVALLKVLLARSNMSSDMIDNTNGMIVMRSYLTTLFFIDKVVIAPDG